MINNKQAGSVLVLVLMVTVLLGLLVASVLRIQGAATKETEVNARESIADEAISYCQAEASRQLSNVNTSDYNLLSSPKVANTYQSLLRQCRLVKIEDPVGAAAVSNENCDTDFIKPSDFVYYQLVAIVQFDDGVKVETRSVVTGNPCVYSGSGM